MNPICFYHISDLDGKASAAIVYLAMQRAVELCGIDYGWKFPWDRANNRNVIMVDFALEPFEEMIRLHDMSNLVWIDHHKTSLESYRKAQEIHPRIQIMGLRRDGTAGCELAWEYFFTQKPMPEAIRLLGRYDVWDNKDEKEWMMNILPFQYGMRALNLDPTDPYWSTLLQPDTPAASAQPHNIIANGRSILAYEDQQNALYAKACSFETVMAEPIETGKPCRQLRVIACNKALTNSRLFDSVWDPEKYDLMASFYLQKAGTWKVSLYTTKPDVDVSVLAKARGGGGHAKAAGFISKELPWWAVGRGMEEPEKAPGSPVEAPKEVE